MAPGSDRLKRASSQSTNELSSSVLVSYGSPSGSSASAEFSSASLGDHSILLKRKNTSRPRRDVISNDYLSEKSDSHASRRPFFARLKSTLAVLF